MFKVNCYYENKNILRGIYMQVTSISRQDDFITCMEVTWYNKGKTFEQTLSVRSEYYGEWEEIPTNVAHDRQRTHFEL